MKKRILLFTTLTLAYLALSSFAKEEAFVYDDHGKRDPFWRLVDPNTGSIISYDKNELQASELVLEGIMENEDGTNIAIINGTIVKENDQLGAYSVVRINPDTVVLKKDDKNIIALKLKKEE